MKDFLYNLINNESYEPPAACTEALDSYFPGALNADWIRRKENNEAIFVKDGKEHIALFDNQGTLIKYKINLQKELLPVLILETLEKEWEIMSVVLINEGNHLIYEVIVRKDPINRYQILLNELGQITAKVKL